MKNIIQYPYQEPPKEGTFLQVAPNIYWIRLPLPLKLDHVNVYALDDGDSWTIVDTGFDTKKTRKIWIKLLEGPLKGKPVKRVLITHYHPDHIGLAGWFQEKFDVELLTTRTSWFTARMLVLDEQEKHTDASLTFYERAGTPSTIYENRKKQRPFNFCDVVSPMPQGFKRVQEDEIITIGRINWRIRLGNGHAPDHITLWTDDVVIGGDQLLPSISPNLGVYPNEPEANPVHEWLESCKKLKKFAKNNQLVLPGHKLPFLGLPLRIDQLIENHNGALKRLNSFLTQPRTVNDCFLTIFKREINEDEYGLALGEALAHLNYLYLSGKAVRKLGKNNIYYYEKL